ncbi:MAG: GTP-binding protein [Limisphaerales bacterium]
MKVRLIVIEGFWGAGKRTVISRLARWLVKRRHRVAILIEDPPYGLAEISPIQTGSLWVEDVPGCCASCRLDFLDEALRNLNRRQWPDTLIVAPVESCADLGARVVRPLLSIYPSGIQFSALSVLVDPFNTLYALGLEPGRGFGPEVRGILRKQMEEAEIIAINKCDVLPSRDRERLEAAIAAQFPRAKVHAVSARTGLGCQRWFNSLCNAVLESRPTMAVRYATFARGEELTEWFDGLVSVSSRHRHGLDPELMLKRLAGASRTALARAGVRIASFRAVFGPLNGWHLPGCKRSFHLPPKQKTKMPPSVKGYWLLRVDGPKAPVIVLGRTGEAPNKGHLAIHLGVETKPALVARALSDAAKELSDMAVFTCEQSTHTNSTTAGKIVPAFPECELCLKRRDGQTR